MKRRLFKLGLLLLAWGVGGAIVNVAVAWGLSTHKPMPAHITWVRLDPQIKHSPTWTWDVKHEGPGRVTVWAESQTYSFNPSGQSIRDENVPAWSRAHELAAVDLHDGVRMVEKARGWPCLALLRRDIRNMRHEISWIEAGIQLPLASDVGIERAMPLHPIWPGFAVNTIFYAAILWVLFFGLGALRRTIRRRRGLCPACGYPVGDSPVCTECGKPLIENKAAASRAP